MTAVLSTAGRFLIGLYLAWSAIASPYGTAGRLAALLLWFSYSAQVFRLRSDPGDEALRNIERSRTEQARFQIQIALTADQEIG